MANLSDAYLKTERAREHLDALRNQLHSFKDTKPHRFRTERDLKAQRYRIYFTVTDVPERLALIVGDFLCCLRASLDHVVWALASLRKSHPQGTEFPILDVPNGRLIRGRTRGVPTDARRIIEMLQPYQAGQVDAVHSHFLWRLNKLCNIDKHRRIPVHSNVSHMRFPDIPNRFTHLLEFDNDNVVVSAPLALERYMRLDPDSSFNIIFGDSVEGIEIDLEGLGRMYQFVANDVLPRFTRFFK